jgi:DNA-binding beta-propeller fold protein YncE
LNDTVTILTTATGKYITKAFRGSDYQAVQFNPGSEFWVAQTPVHNLESLAALISDVETEPTKAIIRGSPSPLGQGNSLCN